MQMVTFSAVSGSVPTVSSVTSEQRVDGGRDGGDDYGDELCRGSDGDVRRDGSDQRSGGEQHNDHGDDTGGECGRGDGDGDGERAERKPEQWFTYLAPPTVSSVSPNSGSTLGGTAVTITGTNFAAGATATFGGTAATNVVVVNSTTITATTPAGSAGAVTVMVTVNGQNGSSDERVHLCGGADGDECIAEQRVDGGRDRGDDHGDELCGGSDSHVRRDGSDQRSGGEQHDDYGDDAGTCGGRSDGDGDSQWTEWKSGQWVHLQRGSSDQFRAGGGGHAAIADGDGIGDVTRERRRLGT